MFSPSFLFASLIWGSVGTGFFIYGIRQRTIVPTMAGTIMVAASYFADTALSMTVVSVVAIAAVFYLKRQGY